MQKDKKNTSTQINLILLKKIGFAVFNKQYNILEIKKFLKKELTN